MVRGQLLSLLLVVSYPIPALVYAADNLRVELKSLQPSYDYSTAREEKLQPEMPAAIGATGGQSVDLPRIPFVMPPPERQAPAQGTVTIRATPAFGPAPVSRLLPATVSQPRLMPAGWKNQDEEHVPEPDISGGTARIAMALPGDQKNRLYKQLYGWSATMAVSFTKPVSTQNAKYGDVVEASLVNDFSWGNKVIVPKNSIVRGHITESTGARTLSNSTMADDRRFRTRGCLGLQFDEIINPDGHRWLIKGVPCRQTNVNPIDANSARVLRVDSQGRLTKSEDALAGKLKAATYTTRAATFAPVPGAVVVTSVATPVAMSAIGAVSPSVAYNKPIGKDVKNRRLKGAVYGFVTNLPGALLVQSFIEKGTEIEIKEGDTVTIATALMDSGYRLPPGEALQVNGQLVKVTPGAKSNVESVPGQVAATLSGAPL